MTSIRSPKDLGAAVRDARKSLQLTQSQLALAAGVGVRFIVDLEAGKSTLQLESILRVIDALGGFMNITGLPGEPPLEQPSGNDHGA